MLFLKKLFILIESMISYNLNLQEFLIKFQKIKTLFCVLEEGVFCHGVFFFAFYGTYAGEGGGEKSVKIKIKPFFYMLEDTGSKVKLKF